MLAPHRGVLASGLRLGHGGDRVRELRLQTLVPVAAGAGAALHAAQRALRLVKGGQRLALGASHRRVRRLERF